MCRQKKKKPLLYNENTFLARFIAARELENQIRFDNIVTLAQMDK